MRTVITLLIVIAPLFGVAQRVSPQVTNLAGRDLTGTSEQIITVSIGEPAITF
jgi:hypothetical protein